MLQRPSPSEKPIGLLVAAIRSGARQLLEARIDALELDLSTQQFWTLVGIAEHPCHSQAELAAWLQMDEATACRVIRALAARRLVRTARDAADRRRIRLALTGEGERLVRTLLPVAREVRSVIESALTPEERAAMRAALLKILGALERLSRRAPLVPQRRPAARRAPTARRTRARSAPATPSSERPT